MHDEPQRVRDKWDHYQKRCRRISESPAFVADKAVDGWLDPAKTSQILPNHAARVHDIAAALAERLDTERRDLSWVSDEQAQQRQDSFECERRAMNQALEHAIADTEQHRLSLERGGFGYLCPDEDQGENGYPPPYRDQRMARDPDCARLQVEALALAVSCIPGSVNNLVINVCPTPTPQRLGPQHSFVIAVAAAAANMLGPALSSISVATPEPPRHRRTSQPNNPLENLDEIHFTQEVVSQLTGADLSTGLQTLRLTGQINELMSEKKFKCWTSTLPHTTSKLTIRRIELWDTKFVDQELSHWLLTLRPGPAQLALRNVHVQKERRYPGQPAPHDTELVNTNNAYLAFALALRDKSRCAAQSLITITGLRIALPSTILVLENVTGVAWDKAVPVAGQRFVEAEVCNVTGDFTEERQLRLLQDFASFVPQWRAEEQREETVDGDAKQFGKLIDAAMASRSYRQWS
ncbi:hypothetical protein LTR95_005027 [Oleoguttula sp. CCFEE 5521]